MIKSVFKENRRYTFSDYFNLTNPIEEIVGEFGYTFSLEIISLPVAQNLDEIAVAKLKQTFYTIIPKISLTSEIAKRDFLIAPILMEIAKVTASKINVEYPLDIDDKLSGSLDYLIRTKQNLIVIEAKKGDLDKGFNQLAAEMIALDKYEDLQTSTIYGAITIGDVWNFALLHRKTKQIIRDIDSYSIPSDTEKVFGILLGIVESTN